MRTMGRMFFRSGRANWRDGYRKVAVAQMAIAAAYGAYIGYRMSR